MPGEQRESQIGRGGGEAGGEPDQADAPGRPGGERGLEGDGNRDADRDDALDRNPESLQPVGGDADRQDAGEHAELDQEQDVRHPVRVEAGDVAEPRGRPQRLVDQERAVADAENRGHAPEIGAGGDRGKGRRRRAPAPGLDGAAAPRRHRGPGQEGDQEGQHGEAHEQVAPAGDLEDRMDRGRRRQRAETAEGGGDVVDQRQAVARPPFGVGLERGHQAGGHAEPDQASREAQHPERLADGEQRRPKRGEHQQHRLNARRAVAVEQQAERNLEGGEGDEIDAGHEAEIGRAQPDLGDQGLRDHRVDDPEQVGEVIAEPERNQHRKHDPERRDRRGRGAAAQVRGP